MLFAITNTLRQYICFPKLLGMAASFSNDWFTMFAYAVQMKYALKLLSALLISVSVSSCAVTSAGVKKGDERNLARSINDVSAGRVIAARMKRALEFQFKHIDVEVAEGVAVLTGNVPSQKDRIEAERIAWSAPHIDQVGNEIHINTRQGLVRNTKDGLLEKSVRTRLTVDKYVKARNFNVETHDGIVYLLGVARDQRELERAARIAATTRGTREVISYARVANLPGRRNAPAGVAQPAAQIFNTPQDYPNLGTNSQIASPIRSLPLSEPIPFTPPQQALGQQGLSQQVLGQQIAGGPTAPPQINIGERLGKELPSDAELGAFRTGAPGEAISVIESPPYYVNPDTGEEIPVRFDANGNIIPNIVR